MWCLFILYVNRISIGFLRIKTALSVNLTTKIRLRPCPRVLGYFYTHFFRLLVRNKEKKERERNPSAHRQYFKIISSTYSRIWLSAPSQRATSRCVHACRHHRHREYSGCHAMSRTRQTKTRWLNLKAWGHVALLKTWNKAEMAGYRTCLKHNNNVAAWGGSRVSDKEAELVLYTW